MGNWDQDRFFSPAGHADARLLAVLAWLWVLVATPFLTNPSCAVYVRILLVFTWLVLAVCWIWLPIFEPTTVFRSPRGRRLWLSAALAGLVGLLLAFTNLGLTARVALSERWLLDYARPLREGSSQLDHRSRVVGLFRVEETEVCDGAVLLFTSPSHEDGQGIAYVPPKAGVPYHVRLVRHLYGPWYRFEQKYP